MVPGPPLGTDDLGPGFVLGEPRGQDEGPGYVPGKPRSGGEEGGTTPTPTPRPIDKKPRPPIVPWAIAGVITLSSAGLGLWGLQQLNAERDQTKALETQSDKLWERTKDLEKKLDSAEKESQDTLSKLEVAEAALNKKTEGPPNDVPPSSGDEVGSFARKLSDPNQDKGAILNALVENIGKIDPPSEQLRLGGDYYERVRMALDTYLELKPKEAREFLEVQKSKFANRADEDSRKFAKEIELLIDDLKEREAASIREGRAAGPDRGDRHSRLGRDPRAALAVLLTATIVPQDDLKPLLDKHKKWTEAIKDNPDSPLPYTRRGLISVEIAKAHRARRSLKEAEAKLDEAIDDFKKARELTDGPGPRKLADSQALRDDMRTGLGQALELRRARPNAVEEELNGKIATLDGKLQGANSEIEKLTDRLKNTPGSETESKLAKALEDLEGQKTKNGELVEEKSKLTEKNKDLAEERDKARGERDTAQTTAKRLENELAAAKKRTLSFDRNMNEFASLVPYQAGLAQYDLGDYQGAAGQFQEAIRLYPRDARYHDFLALARYQLGDFPGAQADAEQGAIFENQGLPNSREVGLALQRVQGPIRNWLETRRQLGPAARADVTKSTALAGHR